MSQELIDHSVDLKKLQNKGFSIEISNGYIALHKVAYVNSNKEIRYGSLISNLSLSGNITTRPNPHTIYFIGDFPCNIDGVPLEPIRHNSTPKPLFLDYVANHMFSNKPVRGYYLDYYEKFMTYIKIISSPAIARDESITLSPFDLVKPTMDSVFNYMDTNSSRANIVSVNEKLSRQRIGIIGVGGTGSYVLDLLAKTPVAEIHLFDGDDFLQHNAFRAPGAPSIDTLQQKLNKCDYMKSIYSNMHRKIITHSYYLEDENFSELDSLDHIFICIDNGPTKKSIITHLRMQEKSFTDLGIGVQNIDSSLIGTLRATSAFDNQYDHIDERISYVDGNNDEYSTNIQIADLNALNAIMGIVQWKKRLGFYLSNKVSKSTVYLTNTEVTIDEDIT